MQPLHMETLKPAGSTICRPECKIVGIKEQNDERMIRDELQRPS